MNGSKLSLLSKTAILVVVALELGMPQTAIANQNGHDFKGLNPTPAGIDFLTVHSSKLLKSGRFNLGLFGVYSSNQMPVIETVDGEQSMGNVDDIMVHADTSFAAGIADIFELGMTSSAVVHADASSNDYRGNIAQTGLTEIRPTLKAGLFRRDSIGMAAVISGSFNQMKNNPYLGTEGGPALSAEIVLDFYSDTSIFALNLGYKSRQKGEGVLTPLTAEMPIAPISDQMIWSMGYSLHNKANRHALNIELSGFENLEETQDLSDRYQKQSEAYVGYRYTPVKDLDFHIGGATELEHGIGSADLRLLVGLNYKFPGEEKKKKKIVKKKKKRKPRLQKPQPILLAALPKPVAISNVKPKLPPKFEVLTVHDVLFPFDSDQLILSKAKNGKLIELANYLKTSGVKRVEIVGHTCKIGSHAYNASLSKRRASSIMNWFATTNVLNRTQMQTIGMGETKPTVSNATDAGRQRNRRVEFRVYR